MLDWFLSGLAVLSRLIQALCQFLLMVMLLITVSQIVARYFFSIGLPWAEEATRYLLVWMVMLGIGLLTRMDDHLGIRAFQDAMPDRLRAVSRFVVFACTFAVAILLAAYGYPFAVGSSFITSAGLQISMAWAFFAIFFGALPLAIYSAVNAIIELIVVFTGKRPKDPRVEADRHELVQLLVEEE
ncbi:TRAP transporter small permease [uncultured Cohaesibacter sp.]|uniref:TRAP transporter small permease n=1 Tax=uncultured Cohaesibacter sp. TaxID=1002546 RepID=UPI00292F9E68|nr:TRAP transporter small permease [uncultured Cohaesibacter sp.]